MTDMPGSNDEHAPRTAYPRSPSAAPETAELYSGVCYYTAGFKPRRIYDPHPSVCPPDEAHVHVFACLSTRDAFSVTPKRTLPVVVMADAPLEHETNLSTVAQTYIDTVADTMHRTLASTGLASICTAPPSPSMWRWYVVDAFGDLLRFRYTYWHRWARALVAETLESDFGTMAADRFEAWVQRNARPSSTPSAFWDKR